MATQSANADWNSIEAKWRNDLGGGNGQANSNDTASTLAGGAPSIDTSGLGQCNDASLKNELVPPIQNGQKNISGNFKSESGLSCMDKYKNIKLGMSLGIPDLMGMLTSLGNQVCNAADSRFNAAVAPITQGATLGPFNTGTSLQTGATGGSNSAGNVNFGGDANTMSTYTPAVPQVIQ